MKKKYIRPEVFYEQYMPSQHIASCVWVIKNATQVYQCNQVEGNEKYGVAGLSLFTEDQACIVQDNCYMGAVEGRNTLIS